MNWGSWSRPTEQLIFDLSKERREVVVILERSTSLCKVREEGENEHLEVMGYWARLWPKVYSLKKFKQGSEGWIGWG